MELGTRVMGSKIGGKVFHKVQWLGVGGQLARHMELWSSIIHRFPEGPLSLNSSSFLKDTFMYNEKHADKAALFCHGSEKHTDVV